MDVFYFCEYERGRPVASVRVECLDFMLFEFLQWWGDALARDGVRILSPAEAGFHVEQLADLPEDLRGGTWRTLETWRDKCHHFQKEAFAKGDSFEVSCPAVRVSFLRELISMWKSAAFIGEQWKIEGETGEQGCYFAIKEAVGADVFYSRVHFPDALRDEPVCWELTDEYTAETVDGVETVRDNFAEYRPLFDRLTWKREKLLVKIQELNDLINRLVAEGHPESVPEGFWRAVLPAEGVEVSAVEAVSGKPAGDKKPARKKPAASREVPDIEELLPHVERFFLGSEQWVKTRDVGKPGADTLRECRGVENRVVRDGVEYGVDNGGRVYCIASRRCYYFRSTMTPESRAFNAFYAGVRGVNTRK